MTNLIIYLFYSTQINESLYVKYIIVIPFFLFFISTQIYANDSTLVRIRTNVDSAEIKINDSLYMHDNYDNKLSAHSWFIISLSRGEFHVVIKFEDLQLDTLITIENQELVSIEFPFILEQTESEIDSVGGSRGIERKLFVTSIPDSGIITIDGKTLEMLTPANLLVNKDTVKVEVYKYGYEPLVTDLMMAALQEHQVQFILSPSKPVYLTADSLGYTFENMIPPLNKRLADKLHTKYMGMAETFMIFPLAQGLILKLTLGDDNQAISNIMVGSGAILTVGSYFLSKILPKRKLKEIEEKNLDIEMQNLEIKVSNQEIESKIRELNAERVVKWKEEKRDKGVVKLIESEE